MGVQPMFLDGIPNPPVHGLHGAPLPVQYLLTGHGCWIPLRIHGDGHVAGESLPSLHLLHNLADNLPGHRVLGQGLPLPLPCIGTTHEVLILQVDEVVSLPDLLNVSSQDGVIYQMASLACQGVQPVGVKQAGVGGDGAKDLGTPPSSFCLHCFSSILHVKLFLRYVYQGPRLILSLFAPPVCEVLKDVPGCRTLHSRMNVMPRLPGPSLLGGPRCAVLVEILAVGGLVVVERVLRAVIPSISQVYASNIGHQSAQVRVSYLTLLVVGVHCLHHLVLHHTSTATLPHPHHIGHLHSTPNKELLSLLIMSPHLALSPKHSPRTLVIPNEQKDPHPLLCLALEQLPHIGESAVRVLLPPEQADAGVDTPPCDVDEPLSRHDSVIHISPQPGWNILRPIMTSQTLKDL